MIDFYATLIATIPATAASTPTDSTSTTHVTYTIAPPTTTHADGDSLTLIESRNIISSSGHTGSRTWEAALALGELLISSHHHTTHPLTFPPNTTTPTIFTTPLPHKHILELGAGTGFLSILCAKLGARKVLATDGDWRVCSSLQKNVAENKVSEVVSVGRLLWGSGNVVEDAEDADFEPGSNADHNGEEQGEKGYITPDVVLAADVVRAYIYNL